MFCEQGSEDVLDSSAAKELVVGIDEEGLEQGGSLLATGLPNGVLGSGGLGR